MASKLNPADFWLSISDRDCAVLLQLPGVAEEHTEEHVEDEPPTKRCRGSGGSGGGGGAGDGSPGGSSASEQQPLQQQQGAGPVVRLVASSQLLKSASEKFQAAMDRWAEPEAAKQLVFQCRGEDEVAVYQHLLAFVHSHGRDLPAEPEAILRLLLLAREHAVEPAVAACLQQLERQVLQLPATVCLTLLSELETGCSAHSSVQEAADALVVQCCRRMGAALEDTALLTHSNVQLHHSVLRYIGPLHGMLNDAVRRQLFASLPHWMLRDYILGAPVVNADTEATVLAATAYWAEFHLPYDVYDALGSLSVMRRQAAELCSRIRFPDIPAHILLNYQPFYRLLRWFDPDKKLIMRAIVSAGDLGMQLAMQQAAAEIDQMSDNDDSDEDGDDEDWRDDADEGGIGKAAARRTLRKMQRWWLPRQPPLSKYPLPADFEFELNKPPETAHKQSSTARYWWGYFWHVCASRELGNAVGLFLVPSMSLDVDLHPDHAKPNVFLYRPMVTYRVYLLDLQRNLWIAQAAGCNWFAPTSGTGSGTARCADGAGQLCGWERFWGPQSPFLDSGDRVRVRVLLNLAA